MEHKIVYDLEVYFNYFLFAGCDVDTNEMYSFELNNQKNELREMMKFLEGKTLIGFNNHKYDDEILKYILVNDCLVMNNDLYNLSKFMIEGVLVPEFRVKYNKFVDFGWPQTPWVISIDIMKILRRMSLKAFGVSIGWKLLQELPCNPHKPLLLRQMKEVKKYCKNDVLITLEAYKKAIPKLEVRSILQKILAKEITFANYKKSFLTLSDSRLAADVMALMYCYRKKINFWEFCTVRKPSYSSLIVGDLITDKIKFETEYLQSFLEALKLEELIFEKEEIFKWNRRSKEKESFYTIKSSKSSEIKIELKINETSYTFGLGGLHSSLKNKVFDSERDGQIIDVDVASYYPNLIVNNKIKPDFLDDVWLEVYKEIIDKRLEAKASGDKLTADALKIVINSLYGDFKYKYFYGYDPKTACSVTLNGQLYLLMLIEQLEMNGYKVISVNTDGITYLDKVV